MHPLLLYTVQLQLFNDSNGLLINHRLSKLPYESPACDKVMEDYGIMDIVIWSLRCVPHLFLVKNVDICK